MSSDQDIPPPTITPPDGGYGWVVVVVCFFNFSMVLILSTSFSVLYVEYMQAFDADVVVVGTVAAYQSISLHMAGFLASSLFQGVDPRPVAMFGSAVASVCCFMASFSNSITMLAVCYTVSGAGSGVMYVAVSPVVHQYFNKRRTLVSSLTIAGFSVGGFVFPPATRYSVDLFGWRGTLALYACICMQNVWLCALHRPLQKLQKSSRHCRNLSACGSYFKALVSLDLLRRPSYLLFSLTSFTVNLNFSVYTFHIVNKCLSDGIDKYKAAFVPSVGSFADAIYGPLFGLLTSTPFLRTKKILLYSLTATGLGLFLILVGMMTKYVAIIVSVAFLSICIASFATMQQPALVDLVGIEKLSSALGLLMFFSGLGQFVGSPLAGYLYQEFGGYFLSYLVTGCLGVVGGLMSLFIIPLTRVKSNEMDQPSE